jgi:hypothetical protein
VNDPPDAKPMTFEIHEDTTLELQLDATDPDDDEDTLVFQVISPPARGKLTGQPPRLLYAPLTNYWGPDAFTFRVTDSQRASDTALISITVLPVNDRPIAESSVEETTQALPIDVVLSGFDPDGDELAYEIVVPPAHGRLSGEPPNLVYSPYVTFSGIDQFTYTGFDGIEESNPAVVTLNVLPLQDPSLLAPRIIEIELVGDTARITWSSWPGGIYRILGKYNLETPEWEPATEEFVAFEQTSTALIPIVSEAAGKIYSVELVR